MTYNKQEERGHIYGCPVLSGSTLCYCERNRYLYILVVGVVVCAVEIFFGLVSGSLAILADAGHLLTDIASSVIALFVASLVLSQTLQHKEHIIRSTGGYAQALLLALLGFLVLREALERLQTPYVVEPLYMIGVGIFAAVGNYAQHVILHRGSIHAHSHVNHWAQRFHVLTDLVYSVVVALGGVIVLFTSDHRFDIYASFFIGGIAWILALVIIILSWNEGRCGMRRT